MKYFLMALALACGGWVMAGGEPGKQGSPMKIYLSEEGFEDVVENIKMAIIERGLLVSGTLHVSDMLNRTAPDLGFSQIFLKAESVEFCSALMSHKMSQAAPENIVNCPFTIAVYVTSDAPKQVHVAYRHPLLAGEAGEAREAIENMLSTIILESI